MASLRKDAHLLRNLVTFEVASRSKTFTEAALELGISRVAVSRQIAELEISLGKPLFVRRHRDVVLTTAGETIANQINPALHIIANTLEKQRIDGASSRLSVTVTTAFATYWLMPKLQEFSVLYPEVEINLIVSDRYLDLATEDIDIAIRYMPRAQQTDGWAPIFQETIFPVYSPRYVAKTRLTTAKDLQQEKLLYLSGRYRKEARWSHWFHQQGLNPPEERTGVQVNTYINMLQAAIEGQGIALAGIPLLNRYLQEGTLKQIDGINPVLRDWYFINCRKDSQDAQDFVAWVTERIGSVS